MKFYSNLNKKVMVVTKNATPYNVEGNSGTTYRIAVLVGDDVEKLKVVDEATYNMFEKGKEYVLSGEFDVRNGKCGEWKVNGFINK